MTISVGVSGTYRTATWKVGVGGVWRPVAEVSVGVAGAWKSSYNALSAVLTSNTYLTQGGGVNYYGYGRYQVGWGSLAPATMPDGELVAELGNNQAGTQARFGIMGIVSSGYLNFVTVNGVTLTGSSATYSNSSGNSYWTWASTFGIADDTVYSAVVVPN